MNKKAKIVVLHMKELVYTGLFLILGVLFTIILILMFSEKDSSIEDIELFSLQLDKKLRCHNITEYPKEIPIEEQYFIDEKGLAEELKEKIPSYKNNEQMTSPYHNGSFECSLLSRSMLQSAYIKFPETFYNFAKTYLYDQAQKQDSFFVWLYALFLCFLLILHKCFYFSFFSSISSFRGEYLFKSIPYSQKNGNKKGAPLRSLDGNVFLCSKKPRFLRKRGLMTYKISLANAKS